MSDHEEKEQTMKRDEYMEKLEQILSEVRGGEGDIDSLLQEIEKFRGELKSLEKKLRKRQSQFEESISNEIMQMKIDNGQVEDYGPRIEKLEQWLYPYIMMMSNSMKQYADHINSLNEPVEEEVEEEEPMEGVILDDE